MSHFVAPTPDNVFHDLEDPNAPKLRSLCGLRVECDRGDVISEDAAPLFARRCRSCLEKRRAN